MENVVNMGELDEWIWSQLETTSHAQDLIDFAIHALGRDAKIEQALDRAAHLYGHDAAQPLVPQLLAGLEERAQGGHLESILTAARWRLLGLGCERDKSLGHAWLNHGISLGYSPCLTAKARLIAESDISAAEQLLEQAVAAGDISAHAHWCSEATNVVTEHRHMALDAQIPYAMWIEGDCLVRRKEEEAQLAGLTLLHAAADANEVGACLSLGIIYWRGESGVEVDLDTASQWLRKGSRLGYPPCMTAHGLVLSEMGDKQQSRRFMTWAALLGDEYGQYALGHDLMLHGASQQEQADGIGWIRRSAEQGYLSAIRFLGWALTYGRGCTAQPEEALRWIQEGVKRGDAESQVMLGCAYADGSGVPCDKSRAHALFHLASLQGHVRGTYLLGRTYLDALGTAIDAGRAIECFQIAAGHKDADAALQLGRLYLLSDLVPRDHAAAARWLRDAAHWGSTEAKKLLGMMLLYGSGVRANPQEAARWLRDAASENDAAAAYLLGKMMLTGEDIELDETEGKRLMVKAASLGDEDAQKWVTENWPEQPQWMRDLIAGKSGEIPLDDSTP